MRGASCNGTNGKPKRSSPTRLLPGRMPAYTTPHGACYQGDCRQLLAELPAESVQLVFTSLPYALRREKPYGNPATSEYIAWLMPIAAQIRRVLSHDGSFVMDIGGAWNAHRPTRSLMPYAMTVEMGSLFELCQDFYWHKTRAMPCPIEWVCRQRVRCKEAITWLQWWAKTPYPYCDQRAVLVPYTRPVTGIRPGKRPSGHAVRGDTWRDNGGAIPPNVFALAGVDTNDPYYHRCQAAGLEVHPCRMPPALPDFFARFLTRPGDLVLDPFAGSNTTGQVAEQLGRRWLGFELRDEYVAGSRLRFEAAPAE